eukprot:Blabericola_migrator_1__11422@NODE_678_length_6912_cov_111_209642_g492_i0_p7_GENE_NODE_678_length_6912_cov_111_209642_g492_i0NODE_678_length_6912_cov_111_209642_g492_i0_p7_ORF_typecomplete_len100_score25_71LRR_4/PF12799_7/1_8e07LRR_4/PF12799_7/7_9e06LRR_9/PF14580_6/7_7e12LRR_8/PF13855_6/0_00044FTH/PF01827_27/0_025LRR_5/PF13306_6/0_12_NODE_678_length_6912_cov_111_209642_g492_i017352034
MLQQMSSGEQSDEETGVHYQRIGVDLEVNPNDEELYFSLSRIRTIENLDGCNKAKTLALVSNLIEKIENLEGCTNLQRLELYQNRISAIENISHLTKLT